MRRGAWRLRVAKREQPQSHRTVPRFASAPESQDSCWRISFNELFERIAAPRLRSNAVGTAGVSI